MRYIIATLLLVSGQAHATMYFAAYDPETQQIGLVYSSSGGHFWQTLVPQKGLAGAQNYGLCEQATPKDFIEQGLSAPEVAARVKAQCDAVDYHSYRFLAVTADGAIDFVIGRDGCSFPECGARRSENFVITGGGLETGILDQAGLIYAAQPKRWSFTCRLFRTLKEIYAAGGETKEFEGASITITGPESFEHSQADIFSGGVEQDLLTKLEKQLRDKGHACL